MKFVNREVLENTVEHVLYPEHLQSYPTTDINTEKKALLRKFSLIVSCLVELLLGFLKCQVRLEHPCPILLRKEALYTSFINLFVFAAADVSYSDEPQNIMRNNRIFFF